MSVQVKICGITRIEDARTALKAGADYLGFIFYPKSPRFIEPDRANELLRALELEGYQPRAIGVFVNEIAEKVTSVALNMGLFAVQLHGEESPNYLDSLRNIKKIKAFRIKDASSLDHVKDYESAWAILCDAWSQSGYGGTGLKFDYDLLDERLEGHRLFLAGGLTPDNAARAAKQVRPFALDVSSGVESEPGVKDAEKMRRFILEAKSATI
jgi:phosphoribosylanthranilate isomerase